MEEKEFRKQNIKDFYNNGFLFTINKDILHPYGLEMQIVQTSKKYSYYDASKKMIETSLSLKDIYNKFEYLEKNAKSIFFKKKLKDDLLKALETIVKLEQKCGVEIKTGKTRILVTRENDEHDDECGIKLSSEIKMADPNTEFTYTEKLLQVNKNLFDEYKKLNGFKIKQRKEALGYVIQELKKEEVKDNVEV